MPSILGLRPTAATLLWTLGLVIVALFLALRLKTTGTMSVEPWDAGWYVGVAQAGYMFDGNYFKQQNVVFFPAFPIAVTLATPVFFGNVHLATFVVALTFTTAGLVLWYRALDAVYAPPVPAMATGLTITYPFSMFLLVGYGECVLFFATAGFFRYWVAQRRPLVAGAFLCLAGVARPAGIMLIFIPLLDLAWTTFIRSAGWRDALAAIHRERLSWFVMPAIAISGLITFQAYQWIMFGDPLLYKHLGNAWNADIGAPTLTHVFTLGGLFEVTKYLLVNPANNPIAWGTVAVIMLPILALKWWMAMPRVLWLECAVLLGVLCLFAFPVGVFYQNAGRYALMFLPGFAAIAISMVASDTIRGERGAALFSDVADDGGENVIAARRAIPATFWLWMVVSLALFLRFVVMFYRVEWVS